MISVMQKFFPVILIIALILIGGIFFYAQDDEEIDSNHVLELSIQNNDVDVIMPTKSSRPGCDETNLCYIPSEITIKTGESVTWQNQDAAFHSITSGFYDKPNDLFDSGHLDPNQMFSVKFEEEGMYDYFCTLHPWMAGKVIVES
jgi:plastocyanin